MRQTVQGETWIPEYDEYTTVKLLTLTLLPIPALAVCDS